MNNRAWYILICRQIYAACRDPKVRYRMSLVKTRLTFTGETLKIYDFKLKEKWNSIHQWSPNYKMTWIGTIDSYLKETTKYTRTVEWQFALLQFIWKSLLCIPSRRGFNWLQWCCWQRYVGELSLISVANINVVGSTYFELWIIAYQVTKGWYLIEKVNDKVAKLISKTEKMAKASPIKSTNLQSEMKTFKNKIKGTILSFSEPPEPSGRFTQWLC